MSRLHGDIPLEHLALEEELNEMEEFFDQNKTRFPKEEIAKGFVCLSHDYFTIGDDEKGSELLEKASKICPGYFDNEIKKHIKEDEMYKILVDNLTHHILQVAKSVLEGIGD